MAFHGWTDAVLDFYEGLERDNSRAYWLAHKAVYDEHVRDPMDALLAELTDEFGPARVFRPNRDMRFSADKSPYKMHVGATLGTYAYVQISADGLGVGSGAYLFATDQLARFRRAVAADLPGDALVRIAADVRAAGLTVTAGSTLATAPRGYPRDHPRIELLRLKGLTTWTQWEPEPWLSTASAKGHVVAALRASVPLVEWFATHVGPSELPPERRR